MNNPIEIYQAQNGETQVEVRFENDTVWLSLAQMVSLFGRDTSVISRHRWATTRLKEYLVQGYAII